MGESTQPFKILQSKDLSELKQIAAEIIKFADVEKVWLFEGEIGAGKTTLIKEICKGLGVSENVSSPTFALVNEYLGANSNSIYHFDFYRLKSETEALDIGSEEYFSSGNICLIEWPSKIESLIPPHHLRISLKVDNNQQRIFHLFKT